jgi:DNA-binding NarL/FixJ family response regulator
MSTLRILIADDHEVVRRGLKALIESQPGWVVEAEAATGREAVEQALRLRPDIVVLDINMPELNGLEAARQILKEAPDTEILILTMHDADHLIREVLVAGARGYVLKTDAGRDLIAAVESLRNKRPFFTRKVSQLVLEGFLKGVSEAPAAEPASGRLTGREREIVQLLAEGKTNKEIAGILNISVKTVDTHRANVMEKLGLRSFSELIRYAVRNYIIE